MRTKIEGRARAVTLKHGAYRNLNSQPCKRDCPERSEDCHATCKKWDEWATGHRLSLEEQRMHEADLDITGLKAKPRSEWEKYRIPNKNIYKKQE